MLHNRAGDLLLGVRRRHVLELGILEQLGREHGLVQGQVLHHAAHSVAAQAGRFRQLVLLQHKAHFGDDAGHADVGQAVDARVEHGAVGSLYHVLEEVGNDGGTVGRGGVVRPDDDRQTMLDGLAVKQLHDEGPLQQQVVDGAVGSELHHALQRSSRQDDHGHRRLQQRVGEIVLEVAAVLQPPLVEKHVDLAPAGAEHVL